MADPTPKACPICGKPAVAKSAPFCSPRCADVDLNRWLKGTYAIPAVESDEDEEGDGQTDDQSGGGGDKLH